MQDFLRAVESQGIPVTDDLQDLKTGHGACHWEKWINRDTGRRSDSAHAYIHSTRAHHSNLHLVCNTKVEKIIMEGGRAVGVKVVPTKPLTPGQDQAKVYRARKQIVSHHALYAAAAFRGLPKRTESPAAALIPHQISLPVIPLFFILPVRHLLICFSF